MDEKSGEIYDRICKCERCEHQWLPKKKEKPNICPKCKSKYWDEKY